MGVVPKPPHVIVSTDSDEIAIRVENLSKLHRMGQFVDYRTLRESLVNVASAPFRRFRSTVADPRADLVILRFAQGGRFGGA